MARMEVVHVRCDRCKRVETRAPSKDQKTTPDFALKYGSIEVKFEDLCASCNETISRLVTQIEQWDREVKQQFGPTVKQNEAPPVSVAPNYSPAQPFAAGAKR